MKPKAKPCVLVFAGHDPSGGAGIQADIEAIGAQGAHALTVITALTVQDNDHVYGVHPVDTQLILQQAMTLCARIPVAAVKLGIVAHARNAAAIADFIGKLAARQSGLWGLPVVLDPVLGSGQGDPLAVDDAVAAIQPLLKVATLITPNLPEARRLCPQARDVREQATQLLCPPCTDVLIKGGHGSDELVCNLWFHRSGQRDWRWPRLSGEFHGSGCTLAAAVAGQLAVGATMAQALDNAQAYSQRALEQAFSIAPGQLIPSRFQTKEPHA